MRTLSHVSPMATRAEADFVSVDVPTKVCSCDSWCEPSLGVGAGPVDTRDAGPGWSSRTSVAQLAPTARATSSVIPVSTTGNDRSSGLDGEPWLIESNARSARASTRSSRNRRTISATSNVNKMALMVIEAAAHARLEDRSVDAPTWTTTVRKSTNTEPAAISANAMRFRRRRSPSSTGSTGSFTRSTLSGARIGRPVVPRRCGYAANHCAVLAGSLAYRLAPKACMRWANVVRYVGWRCCATSILAIRARRRTETTAMHHLRRFEQRWIRGDRGDDGLTIVELIIVVAILAILTTTVVISVSAIA